MSLYSCTPSLVLYINRPLKPRSIQSIIQLSWYQTPRFSAPRWRRPNRRRRRRVLSGPRPRPVPPAPPPPPPPLSPYQTLPLLLQSPNPSPSLSPTHSRRLTFCANHIRSRRPQLLPLAASLPCSPRSLRPPPPHPPIINPAAL
jgi:hypothetical protein